MERHAPPVHEDTHAPRSGTRGIFAFASSAAALLRLAEAAEKPLAVIIAPPGFGKTMLLREFAAERSAVTVDLASGAETFRDAVRMTCDALRTVAPGARLAFASAYTRAVERGQPAAALGRWLARYLDGAATTVAIDSADRLGAETRELAEFLEALVRHAPATRIAIAARDHAELPIPRWFADDLIVMPLGADDLRWDPAEARAAARRFGDAFDDSALDDVIRSSQGRPFDLVYAFHTGAPPPPGADPGATLLASLGAAERAYVLDTCLLGFIDDTVLNASGLRAGALLDAGSRLSDLVLVWHGDGFRYDEALRTRAEQVLREDAGAYVRVASRTVDALESAGRLREALDLARTARLAGRVRRLLCAHGLQLEDRGDADAVEAALDVLEDDVEDDAVILLLRATRESRLGRTDTSEAWFRHAVARADTRTVSAEAACRLAREIVRRDRSDAVELLEPYRDDAELSDEQRAEILSVLAEAYLAAARPDDARAALRAALDCAEGLEIAARAHLYTRASYVEFFAGDRASAKEYAHVGVALAAQANLYVVAFGSYSVLYNLAYDDGGPSEGLAYLEKLAESAIRSGDLVFHLYAIIAAYEMQVERGDAAAIEGLERDLREFDVHYGARPALEGLLPSRALVAAWKGEFASAFEILAPSGEQQQDLDREALRWAEIALYAAAARMHVEAQEALTRFTAAFTLEAQPSAQAVRGAVIARLAATLCGADAAQLPAVETTGRLRSLERAVDAVIASWHDHDGAGALLSALDELQRCELGGFAKLFAALPVADR